MEKTEGKCGNQEDPFLVKNADSPHFSKQNPPENDFLRRSEKEDIERVRPEKIIRVPLSANPRFVDEVQPDSAEGAEKEVPAQGMSQIVCSEPQFMKAVPSEKTAEKKTRQDAEQYMKTIVERNNVRPD